MAAAGLWMELVIGGTAEGVDGFYAAGRFDGVSSGPGVGRTRRFGESDDGPRHLLLAELEDPAAAREHLRVTLAAAYPLDDCPAPQTRALFCTAIPRAVHGICSKGQEGPLKFVVGMAVNPLYEDEYNRWYDAEHIPILLRHDGWLGARRYHCESQVAEYVTIYEVAHTRILSPEARADVRSTDWSRDVLARAFATHTKAFFAEIGAG